MPLLPGKLHLFCIIKRKKSALPCSLQTIKTSASTSPAPFQPNPSKRQLRFNPGRILSGSRPRVYQGKIPGSFSIFFLLTNCEKLFSLVSPPLGLHHRKRDPRYFTYSHILNFISSSPFFLPLLSISVQISHMIIYSAKCCPQIISHSVLSGQHLYLL